MQQQLCPNCGHRNRPGIIFCENCGASLIGHSPMGTKALGATETAPSPASPADRPADAPPAPPAPPLAPKLDVAIASLASDLFKPGWALRMEVEGGQSPVLLTPRQELILGRRDPATGAMPDLDMTPFAGYRMGVSRRHAAIRLTDTFLDLWDLGSSNGTFLNGTRLVAYRPYRLRDGDEIRLGQMAIRAYFQPPKT